MTGRQIGNQGTGALVGDRLQRDADFLAQQHAEEVRHAAHRGGAEILLARVLFQPIDEAIHAALTAEA